MRLRLSLILLVVFAPATFAADTATIRTKYPHLFHPQTGYRIDRQRAPTPDDIPAPSKPVSASEAKALLDAGAVAIDVFGAPQSRYDELEGTWLVRKPRLSLPGAVWLPEVGRGVLSDELSAFLADNLGSLTGRDFSVPLLVYCVADCWMSWNAAQRIAGLGYTQVKWFRLGTDGWLDEGWALEPVMPVPVKVD